MLENGISQAMILLVEKTEELETLAEDSKRFSSVVASIEHHRSTLTLIVGYCSPSSSITLSMRLWEPASNMVPMIYNSSYEALIATIFTELLKFAMEGDFEQLKEVRKVLVLESN